MRRLIRYLPTVLIAVCFLPGHFIGHFFTGPGMSLWNRLALGVPCAWLLAMLLGSFSLLFTRTRPEPQRILILTISTVILFFPLRGLSRGVAEELELQERILTGYQSDTGISYMYGEMSGMGFADGLAHWPEIISSWFFLAIITAIFWLPLAFLFSRWTARLYAATNVG
ncbi:MAG TPA: hypothetical protein VF593_04110 [Chthoniobacteraceae bacterium]|jgi:hypothetical protein